MSIISDQIPDLPPFMVPGWEAEIGSHTFSSEDIITFAKAYDPQHFHLDADAAKASVFGGLCASGWHTASLWMRKQRDYVDAQAKERTKNNLPLPEFGPSPGFKNLKWLRPVFAGDTVTYFNSTDSCRKSKSKPDWWIISGRQFGKNQNGDRVISFESSVFLKYPS